MPEVCKCPHVQWSWQDQQQWTICQSDESWFTAQHTETCLMIVISNCLLKPSFLYTVVRWMCCTSASRSVMWYWSSECHINTSSLTSAVCVVGGFYTVKLKTGLRLVMLNSNLWYYQDHKMANSSDPAGQFVWLENVLKDAEQQSNLVSFSVTLILYFVTVSLLAFSAIMLSNVMCYVSRQCWVFSVDHWLVFDADYVTVIHCYKMATESHCSLIKQVVFITKQVPYIPTYKLQNFGQFFAPKLGGGQIICGTENLPSAVGAVVSGVSCIESNRLVGRVWVTICLWNLIHHPALW